MVDNKTPEERWARIEERHEALAQSLELLSIAQQKTERTLRRAIHLAVLEARQERNRRQELQWHADEKITQLAAAQLITEEKLQRLEKSVEHLADRQGGNGNPPIH